MALYEDVAAILRAIEAQIACLVHLQPSFLVPYLSTPLEATPKCGNCVTGCWRC